MSDERYDVAIIGAGQAAQPLAFSLAAAGKRVVLFERKHLGGSCVNFGCTPSKALIASASTAHGARTAKDFGILVPEFSVDFPAVMERARAVAAESRDSLGRSLRETSNPTLVRAQARLAGRDGDLLNIEADGRSFRATDVVLDTGTRSLVPEIPGLADVPFLDAGNWIDLTELPPRLLLLGGGYIALEMGQAFRRLGSEVVVVEQGARVAAHEDEDVSNALRTALERDGIEFRLGSAVQGVRQEKGGVVLATGTGEVSGTHLFVATGRTPNTDDLGLESIGLDPGVSGIIEVDRHLRGKVPGLWAVGDIRGGPQFTHTAYDDFQIVESRMLADGAHTTERVVGYAIFTEPQLGRVGMTETEARHERQHVAVGRLDMKKNGKARELGKTGGFIKVIADGGSRLLLGAAALCESGSEIVQLLGIAMNAGMTADAVVDAVMIHPTLAEAVQSAVEAIEWG